MSEVPVAPLFNALMPSELVPMTLPLAVTVSAPPPLVEGVNAVTTPDSSARAGGHAEIEAGVVVIRIDAGQARNDAIDVTDIAMGGDGQRAGAIV